MYILIIKKLNKNQSVLRPCGGATAWRRAAVISGMCGQQYIRIYFWHYKRAGESRRWQRYHIFTETHIAYRCTEMHKSEKTTSSRRSREIQPSLTAQGEAGWVLWPANWPVDRTLARAITAVRSPPCERNLTKALLMTCTTSTRTVTFFQRRGWTWVIFT